MTDSGSKAMGSLYDVLLNYVDSSRVHDSNYETALTLVEHYHQLSGLSLKEMAELCFVSQASLSRFCRFLGFESFAEFKEAIDGANYRLADDYTRDFMGQLSLGERQALDSYRASLIDLINETLDEENLVIASQVLDVIEGAGRVVLFSHHFPWQIGRYFQNKMLQMGKFVELYQSYEHQLEAAESLVKGDVAIVLSINGTYFSHYNEIMRGVFSSGATVVAITQNRRVPYINRVDYLLRCGCTNDNDLGKYAALMTIDYLIMSYLKRTTARQEQQ